MMKKALWTLLVPALIVATACSSDSSSSAATSASSPAAGTELTVFAASSLTGAFTQMGTDFETANPGVHVTFNFGSSTDLAAQIASEGTADVFASASGTAMDAAAADPGVEDRADFATNQLVIITPSDDPANIGSVDDLANEGVQVVLAAEGVPVGDYAREMLDNAGISKDVLANVVSNEPDDACGRREGVVGGGRRRHRVHVRHHDGGRRIRGGARRHQRDRDLPDRGRHRRDRNPIWPPRS